MACLLCGSEPATRRIVDLEDESIEAEVCEHCAERHLLVDPGSPTCGLCSEMADFDLAKVEPESSITRPFDVDSDLEVVEKDVICEEDLQHLRAEASSSA